MVGTMIRARMNMLAQVRMKSTNWYTEVAIRSTLIGDRLQAVFVALSWGRTAAARRIKSYELTVAVAVLETH
jgi:hypothetical protein